MAKSENTGAFSSKKMLAEHGAKGTKISYTDRMKIKVTQDTRFHKAGDILNPHKVKAQAMIDQGLAEKYVEKESK